MKKAIYLITTLLISFSACKTADNVTPSVGDITTAAGFKSNISTGNWSIASYRQKSEDKSSTFTGFTFVFKAGGTVTATKGSDIVNGTWIYTEGTSSYYGATPAPAAFNLNMNGTGNFTKINKSWDVSYSSSANELKLDNREPTEDEHLVFTK